MKKTGGDVSVKEQAELFCMQYMMRRDEVYHVADVFAEALAEDHQKNADMFDVGKLTFSDNPHPNATMRVLEQELADKDLPFLCMLFALIRVGADLVLALADFECPADFADAAAEEFAVAEARYTDAAYLASELTAPKAEHQSKRLRAAIEQMRAIWPD